MDNAFRRNVVNAIWLNVHWFLAVVFASAGVYWPLLLSICVYGFVRFAGSSRPTLSFLLVVTVVGFCMDSLNVYFGFISFRTNFVGYFSPPWIALLWTGVALSFDRSLAWMADRRVPAVLLSAIAGPLGYFSASKLGAVEIHTPVAFVLYASISWGVAVPLMAFLANKGRAT